MATEILQIQFRRNTAAAWAADNPILKDGEPGLDVTNRELRIGDGTSVWTDLPVVIDSSVFGPAIASAVAADVAAADIPGQVAGAVAASPTVQAAAAAAVAALGSLVTTVGAEAGLALVVADTKGRALISFGMDGAATFPKAVNLPAGSVTAAQLAASVQAGLAQQAAGESGIVFAITDAAGRTLMSIGMDGTVTIPKLVLSAGSVTQTMLSTALQAAIPQVWPSESGLMESYVDAAGRIYAGTRVDGSRFAKGLPDSPSAVSANYVISTEADSNGDSQIFSTRRSTGVKTQLTTVGQNTSPVLDSADNVLFRSDQGRPSEKHAHLWLPAAGGVVAPMFSRTDLTYCPGDSLTAGSNGSSGMGYPQQLGLLLGKAVINDGSGGQTSEQIAARQGGTPVNITFSSNTIAATTAAQTVTASLDALVGAGGAYSRPGTIGGVHGTLAATGTNQLNAYTFTCDTAGVAVALTGATPFIPDTVQYRGQMQGFFSGRNNFKTDPASQIVADVQSQVMSLTAYAKRYWVFLIPPWVGEEIGQNVRNTLDAANAALMAAFPSNYIDGPSFLRTDAAFTLAAARFPSAGIVKTSQDVTDIGNGLTPTTFRTNVTDHTIDAGHLNDYGYYVLAYLARQFIAQKGWA